MGDGKKYIGWSLRHFGRVRESIEADERAYRLNPLDTMSANLYALGKMGAGQAEEAVPVFEDLVARVPDMSFPLSSLLRAQSFLGDWAAVDRLLEVAAKRDLREFEEGLKFIRAKREPTRGTSSDVMGPDGYRTSMLFQANMPELRSDPRFVTLCARLGLVEFWTTTGKWPDCADEVPYDFRMECERTSDLPKKEVGF